MQIQVSDNQPSIDITITTIGIAIDPLHPKRTFLLHCYKCGKDLMQTQGKLTRIIPWLEPTVIHIVIHKCTGCGEKYTTQDTPLRQSVLVRLQPMYEFYCLICRLLLMGQVCKRCNTVYDFKD